jgi:hypothetical protein
MQWPTVWTEVNNQRLNVFKSVLLVKWIAFHTRLQVYRQPQLIRFLLPPFHQCASSTAFLILRICMQHVKVYTTISKLHTAQVDCSIQR